MKKRHAQALTAEELAAMPDEDINTDDIPELGDEFWKNARVRYPAEGKERLTIRFDRGHGAVVFWSGQRVRLHY